MPKYLTRIEFESMKVLRNRKCTIKQISEKMHISAPAVSRNLKYHSYEDYCLNMHNRNSRGGKEIEAKSGPVKVTKSAASKKCNKRGKEKPLEDSVKDKTCKKCGKTKPITEFDKNKNNKDGHSWQCKECRRAYQRKYDKKSGRHKAKKPAPTHATDITYYNPVSDCWVSEPQPAKEPKKEEKTKLEVGQHVYIVHKNKVKTGRIVDDNGLNSFIVELDNWRKTKVHVDVPEIYLEEECSN